MYKPFCGSTLYGDVFAYLHLICIFYKKHFKCFLFSMTISLRSGLEEFCRVGSNLFLIIPSSPKLSTTLFCLLKIFTQKQTNKKRSEIHSDSDKHLEIKVLALKMDFHTSYANQLSNWICLQLNSFWYLFLILSITWPKEDKVCVPERIKIQWIKQFSIKIFYVVSFHLATVSFCLSFIPVEAHLSLHLLKCQGFLE